MGSEPAAAPRGRSIKYVVEHQSKSARTRRELEEMWVGLAETVASSLTGSVPSLLSPPNSTVIYCGLDGATPHLSWTSSLVAAVDGAEDSVVQLSLIHI